jgi:hypothetical protein
MKISDYLLIALILVLLVGCQPVDGVSTSEPASPSSPVNDAGTDTMQPPMTSSTPGPAAQELVLQAKEKLAKKLGISVEEIFLFSVEAVEWPDASLGCPQTGMAYAQVITPGYRILLEANGQVYSFHTDEANQVVLCSARGPDEIYLPP